MTDQQRLFDLPDVPTSPWPKERVDAGNAYVKIGVSPVAGYGVFAVKDIPANTVIHLGPVLFLEGKHLENLDFTGLHGYVFTWIESDDEEENAKDWLAFPLGIAGLFNHSFTPNAEYEMWYEGEEDEWGHVFEYDTILFKTAKNVTAGEELFVSYADTPEELWFDLENDDEPSSAG